MSTNVLVARRAVGDCQARSDAEGRPELAVRTAADVVAEPVRWLWKDHFPLGKISVVAGASNVGKSLLVAGDFAARVSTGSPWPDGSACPVGDVLIASGHDGAADTLVPRLRDHGADLKRVHFVEGLIRPLRETRNPKLEIRNEFGMQRKGNDGNVAGNSKLEIRTPSTSSGLRGPAAAADRLFTLGGLAQLERALRQRPEVELVVVDPVSAFLDAGGSAARLAGMLSALQGLAQRCGAAFILVTALREAAGGAPLARAGSAGLMSAARSVWVLTRDPGQEQRRLFTPAKNNLGADGAGYAWRLVDGKVQWESKPLEKAAPADDAGRSRRRRETLAAAFIADFLAGGPRMWAAIEFHAKLAGHRPATLERARGSVAETFKRAEADGRWLWRLIGDDRTSSEGDIADFFDSVPIGPPVDRRSGRGGKGRGGSATVPVIEDEDEDEDVDEDDDD
jgi:putative DNA primase/helicase